MKLLESLLESLFFLSDDIKTFDGHSESIRNIVIVFCVWMAFSVSQSPFCSTARAAGEKTPWKTSAAANTLSTPSSWRLSLNSTDHQRAPTGKWKLKLTFRTACFSSFALLNHHIFEGRFYYAQSCWNTFWLSSRWQC